VTKRYSEARRKTEQDLTARNYESDETVSFDSEQLWNSYLASLRSAIVNEQMFLLQEVRPISFSY